MGELKDVDERMSRMWEGTQAKTILYDRYLAGMSWREIEEKRGFTRQWLARMRDRAIRMISQNTS